MRMKTLLFVATVAVLSGCSPDAPNATMPPPPMPQITALSALSASVGDEVQFAGSGFVDPGFGWVDVSFQGTFVTDEGDSFPVDLTIPLRAELPNLDTVVWERFGGYRVPFGPGDMLGTFNGTVFATNRYFDGNFIAQDEPSRILLRFEVEPSIVVVQHRAFGDGWHADCAEPTTTTLGGLPYRMEVEALGFEADQIEFLAGPGLMLPNEEGEVAGREQPTRFELLGEPGEANYAFVGTYSPVPEYRPGYSSFIDVYMRDTSGRDHQLMYPFVVNAPFSVVMNEDYIRAEVLPPEPVSGCTPGGEWNQSLSYSEQRSETRSRTTQFSVNRGWNRSLGSSHSNTYGTSDSTGGSRTLGTSVSTSVANSEGGSVTETEGTSTSRTEGITRTRSESTDDGFNWNLGAGGTEMENAGRNTNVSAGVEGGVGIPLVANGKATASVGHGVNSSWGQTTQRCPEPGNAAESRVRAQIDERLGGSINANTSDEIDRENGAQGFWAGGRGRTRNSVDERQDGCWSFGGSFRESTSNSVAESESTTESESFSRAVGRNWSISRTYSEQQSYSTSDTWNSSESFSEAKQTSENIGESTGESESVSETISTSESESLQTTSFCYAGYHCTWYRQTTRYVRYGAVLAYDLCGNADVVGEIKQEDWAWSPGLAVGPSCEQQAIPFGTMSACLEPPCNSSSQ